MRRASLTVTALTATLLGGLTLGVCGCRSVLPRSVGAASDTTDIVYVVRRSWHIDIGFAASALQPPLASLRTDFPGVLYLDFGFGDRHYLMTRRRGSGSLLAALWPGPGLILLTALTAPPEEAFGSANVIPVAVTPAQSRDIQRFIWQSLSTDAAPVKPVAAGPYGGSAFYAATPDYSALHTCNTWAAQALQSAPLPIRSGGVELAGQVWTQVQHLTPRR